MQLKLFCKRDLALILGIIIFLLICVTIYTVAFSDDSSIATIEKDGQTLYQIDLSVVEEPYRIPIEGDYPLTVSVENDGISVVDASCPDQVCVHTGQINKSGQSIICVPARVSISIGGKGENDAITG